MKKPSDSFWETVERNKLIVKTWPKWMQRIVITAETASTGKFIQDEQSASSNGGEGKGEI